MPFAPKINQDQAGQAPQASQAAPKLSGVSTSFNVPGSGQAQAPGAAKTQKSSGQFQNIEKYIQANQPQGQELGQKIAQNVESKVGESSAQLQKMSTALPSTSQYKPEETIGKAESLQAPEIAAYKQMKSTGGYTGPQDITGLAGYNEAFKASEAAKEAVSKASGEAGQQALLQETFARPDYTKGSNILDQIILAGSQGGKQAITDVGEKYKGLSDYLSNQFGVSQKQIESSQAQAQANKEAIAQAEKKAMEDLINPLQATAEKRNIEYPELQKRIAQDIQDYNLTPETLAALGINVGQNVYNLNLADYVTPDQTQQNINSVASDWQRQRYQALSNLFDQNAGLISEKNPMPGYAPISFNKEQFSKDVAGKETEYKQASAQPVQKTDVESSFPKPKSIPEARLQSNLKNFLPQLSIDQMKEILAADKGINGSWETGKAKSVTEQTQSAWKSPVDMVLPPGSGKVSFNVNQSGWEQVAKPIMQDIVNKFDNKYGASSKIGEA